MTTEAYPGNQFYRRASPDRFARESETADPNVPFSRCPPVSASVSDWISLAVLKDWRSRDNLILAAGDSIYVPEYDPLVTVIGSERPWAGAFEPGKNLDWYVSAAGGYAEKATKAGLRDPARRKAGGGASSVLFLRRCS